MWHYQRMEHCGIVNKSLIKHAYHCDGVQCANILKNRYVIHCILLVTYFRFQKANSIILFAYLFGNENTSFQTYWNPMYFFLFCL